MEKPVLAPAFLRELARDNPLGITIKAKEVRAWFDYVAWPSYKTYQYKLHKRAIRRWWARIRMQELERARDAMAAHDAERLQKIQDRILTMPNDGKIESYPALRKIMGGKP